MKRLMTPEHPGWAQFCDRLGGPEGCDFHEDENGVPRWRCKGGLDKTFARAILDDLPDIDVEGSLGFFEEHGGHCDCEILFNVDR